MLAEVIRDYEAKLTIAKGALEFYAGPFGIHHGYEETSINEIVQKELNEKGSIARQALEKLK